MLERRSSNPEIITQQALRFHDMVTHGRIHYIHGNYPELRLASQNRMVRQIRRSLGQNGEIARATYTDALLRGPERTPKKTDRLWNGCLLMADLMAFQPGSLFDQGRGVRQLEIAGAIHTVLTTKDDSQKKNAFTYGNTAGAYSGITGYPEYGALYSMNHLQGKQSDRAAMNSHVSGILRYLLEAHARDDGGSIDINHLAYYQRQLDREVDFVTQAYEVMEKQQRGSGESTKLHPVAVSELATIIYTMLFNSEASADQLNDVKTIALFHDILEDLRPENAKKNNGWKAEVVQRHEQSWPGSRNKMWREYLVLYGGRERQEILLSHGIADALMFLDEHNAESEDLYLNGMAPNRRSVGSEYHYPSDKVRAVKIADRILNAIQWGSDTELERVVAKFAENMHFGRIHGTVTNWSSRHSYDEIATESYDPIHPGSFYAGSFLAEHRVLPFIIPTLSLGGLFDVAARIRPYVAQILEMRGYRVRQDFQHHNHVAMRVSPFVRIHDMIASGQLSGPHILNYIREVEEVLIVNSRSRGYGIGQQVTGLKNMVTHSDIHLGNTYR